MSNKKEQLSFILSDTNGKLSKDIGKLIKTEELKKIEDAQIHNNKGESGF